MPLIVTFFLFIIYPPSPPPPNTHTQTDGEAKTHEIFTTLIWGHYLEHKHRQQQTHHKDKSFKLVSWAQHTKKDTNKILTHKEN